MHSAFRICAGQDDSEFFTAVTARYVVLTDGLFHDLTHHLEHSVTLVMSVGIIEFLEMISIEHDHSQRRASVTGALEFSFQCGVEVPSVEHIGESICNGQAL